MHHLLATATVIVSLCVFASGHGTLTKPSPRGHFDANGDPFQIYENNPTRTGNPAVPDFGYSESGFVCRGRPAETPRATLRAGERNSLGWDFSASHVGSCALYISYDHDKPEEEMEFFKIAHWANCRDLPHEQYGAGTPSDDRRRFDDIQTWFPSWLPDADHAVLRYEWVATHAHPNLEFFNQCADIRIEGGMPAGSPLPDTYKIGPHIPSTSEKYCNWYHGGCTEEDDEGVWPPLATDPSPARTRTPKRVLRSHGRHSFE